MNSLKKVIYTLNINGYSEAITQLTYPLIEGYAKKIGAEFVIITERKFPAWPVVYEKLQIHELGKNNDWSIYVDGDVLINPDLFDLTAHIAKDTVLQFGQDFAGNRWKYDKYFLRDGRFISTCSWFTITSDWCLDFWHPLTDMSLDEALENINTVIPEQLQGISHTHLIDDYVISRNVAKYGLKYTTCMALLNRLDPRNPGNKNYFFHEYLFSENEKVKLLKERLKLWGCDKRETDVYAIRYATL